VYRAACLLIASLVGCDTVWGLERDDDAGVNIDDEDGDGVIDRDDPCPHIAFQSTTDADLDGVPADCDPDDAMPDTRHVFYAFNTLEPGLDVQGGDPVAQGAMVFGATTDGLSTFVIRDIVAETLVVDVGFDVLGTTSDQGGVSLFDELGVYSVHRGFSTDNMQRGDVCFFGTNMHDVAHPKPVYLEMAEDNSFQSSVPDASTLTNTSGRFRMKRTPIRVDCTVFRDGLPSIPNQFNVADLVGTVGKVALSAQRARVRLRYVWFAYQPVLKL
jgi:hypothetical protein